VVAHTLWTSAAPAIAYPLYARQWALSPTIATVILPVYPVTVGLALPALCALSGVLVLACRPTFAGCALRRPHRASGTLKPHRGG
jgi:hypothetical protein